MWYKETVGRLRWMLKGWDGQKEKRKEEKGAKLRPSNYLLGNCTVEPGIYIVTLRWRLTLAELILIIVEWRLEWERISILHDVKRSAAECVASSSIFHPLFLKQIRYRRIYVLHKTGRVLEWYLTIVPNELIRSVGEQQRNGASRVLQMMPPASYNSSMKRTSNTLNDASRMSTNKSTQAHFK